MVFDFFSFLVFLSFFGCKLVFLSVIERTLIYRVVVYVVLTTMTHCDKLYSHGSLTVL